MAVTEPVPRVAAARTLTEALRGWTAEQLEQLFIARPDLGYPPPRDLVDLAGRAATLTSVTRALDRLNAFQWVVVEALAALPDRSTADGAGIDRANGPTTTITAVAELLDHPAAELVPVFASLRDLALSWGDDDHPHLVRAVRESFGPYPGGLAPASPRPLTPEQIEHRLASCGEAVRPVLDRLCWSPAGRVRQADRRVDPASPRSPVEALLAHGLLRAVDAETVILPREVALQLRGGRFSPDAVAAAPPPVPSRPGDLARADRAAAGAAYELVHDVELAVELVQQTPHRLLRDGGLASRDLTALGRRLGTEAPRTAFLLELAAAAGLVGDGPGHRLLPTPGFDAWVTDDAADRWRALAGGWVTSPREFARAAVPGGHVLGPEGATPGVPPAVRTLILTVAATAGSGAVLDPADLAEAVTWHSPRLARTGTTGLGSLVAAIWREAGWLGLVSLGAVSSFAVAITAPGLRLPDGLRQLFPTTVDQVVVQADLTAVAAGPLPADTARELRLLADQESRGGGGVFRFSAASIRRGFQAGWTAAELHRWLAQHSSTGVPQPLAYLVDDVARQIGRVRVGFAGSFVQIEDAAAAAALLRADEATALGLREIAPSVLISPAEPSEVAAVLQQLGHAPTAEDESGRPATRPPRLRASRTTGEPPPLPSAEAATAAVLAGERAGRAPLPPGTESILDLLETATATARPIRVGYVAADGAAAERELAPLDLGDGRMRAVDRRTAQVVSIPLARISSVNLVPADH
jgi:hypothetical protein